MTGGTRVLIALDEPSLARLMEIMVGQLGLTTVIADGEVDAFEKLEEFDFKGAITIPKFHGLSLALNQSKPRIKTLLLCADLNTNGFRDGDHLKLLPIPCPADCLRAAMKALVPEESSVSISSTAQT